MTKALQISKDLSLPLDAVTERIAFLGMSGGGKTYAAMKLAEEMLEVGAQIVVLDPVGPWWGLRDGADGKTAGYPINVFGGIHGDLPLTPTAGSLMADVLAERAVSAVLDVSDLFLEEAHNFAPQQLPPGDPGAAVMMHRIDRIVRVGRNYGIGSSIISQQPQAVSKRVLNQARTLFAFTTGGKQERKAIIDWFSDKSGDTDPDVLFDELKKLEPGVAHVASPQWLKVEKPIRIAKKKTFDSSRTPKFGEVVVKPKHLAPVDLAQLKDAMAEVVAAAEQSDPSALKKKVIELQAEVKKLQAAKAPKVETKEKIVRVPDEAMVKRLEAAATTIQKAGEMSWNAAADVAKALREITGQEIQHRSAIVQPPLGRPVGAPIEQPRPPQQRETGMTGPIVTRTPVPRSEDSESGELTPVAMRMLENVARCHPHPVTRRQLATLSGYSPKKSSYRNVFSVLNSRGLVVKRGDDVALSDSGLAVFKGELPQAQTAAEIVSLWRGQLSPVAWRMLSVVLKTGPIQKGDLAKACGYDPGVSSFRNVFSILSANELIEKSGDTISAAPELLA